MHWTLSGSPGWCWAPEIGSFRVARADGVRTVLRILVIARRTITRESSVRTNALTARARTEDLGIDMRKALRIDRVQQIAG